MSLIALQLAQSAHETTMVSMHDDREENFFKEVIKFGLLAIVIVLPIRLFIAQPFVVSGASMEPTFGDSEYLIVDELTYQFEDPKRGDVIIFKYPKDPSKYFIKRIIGLPGEAVSLVLNRIEITTKEDTLLTLEEPYVVNDGNGGFARVVLGEDEYFVMGDNRSASSDSRSWGPLPRDNIIGRAFLRLLPLTTFDIFPGSVAN